jgi:hypothetical protein
MLGARRIYLQQLLNSIDQWFDTGAVECTKWFECELTGDLVKYNFTHDDNYLSVDFFQSVTNEARRQNQTS